MKRYAKRTRFFKKIASQRVRILYNLALENFDEHPERAARYAELLKKIALRHNLTLPKDIKLGLCKKCGSLLIPGRTSRSRLKEGRLVQTCLNCGRVRRIPYTPKRGEKNERTRQKDAPGT